LPIVTLWAFSALCVLVAFFAFRERSGVLKRLNESQLESTSRKAMELVNEWNRGVAMPRIDDIIEGRDPIRPMEKDGGPCPIVGECATVRFEWESGPVDVGIDRLGDGSEPFIDRAVSGYKYLSGSVPPTSRR